MLRAPSPGDRRDSARPELSVAMLWGDALLDVRRFRVPRPVTVGAGTGNDFALFDPRVGESFQLVEAASRAPVVAAPEGADLTVVRNGRSRGACVATADDGAACAVALARRERAVVGLGAIRFVVSWAGPAEPARGAAPIDFAFARSLSATAMVFVVLMAAVGLTDVGGAGLWEDLFRGAPPTWVARGRPPRTTPVWFAPAGGERAPGDEGRFGRPDARLRNTDRSRARGGPVDPDKRSRDRAIVESLLSGIFDAAGPALSVLRRGGSLGEGINQALHGIRPGGALGEAAGWFGLGVRRVGPGGGGDPLTLGRIGTRGGGPPGLGGFEVGAHRRPGPVVDPTPPQVLGGCDASVVGRSIARRATQIRYCYEQALGLRSDLTGKLSVSFIIDAGGAVSEAEVRESTLGDAGFETCVLRQVRRWRFDPPRGGGQCLIHYPWLLKPAG